MLELCRIRKVYSGVVAVEEVSFTARAGEITGYLGANGSGKSTTMKMVTELIEPTGGTVLFDGKPILEDLMSFRQKVGYVPEEALCRRRHGTDDRDALQT
jgi:ABC-2 type transport system ATP-binding protein